jgi:hypothetical protein
MFIADNYIIGFPTETFGQMRDSFRFSLEMNLDWSNYAVYQHNVNSFGDKASKTSNEIGDFIPTKDTKRGKLDKTDSILRGPAVFNLSSDSIPSREQLSQIWFSFNLLRNFIGNKNLQEGGRPDKFLSWVGVVEERYPTHPYMNFFSSLGHCLQGNENELEMQYKRMIKNLLDAYWEEVFREFNMDQVVSNFPRSRIQAREAIAYLIDQNIPK